MPLINVCEFELMSKLKTCIHGMYLCAAYSVSFRYFRDSWWVVVDSERNGTSVIEILMKRI